MTWRDSIPSEYGCEQIFGNYMAKSCPVETDISDELCVYMAHRIAKMARAKGVK